MTKIVSLGRFTMPLVLFVFLTVAVAVGLLHPLDTRIELAARGLWSPALAWSWAVLDVAGSVLASGLILLGLAALLRRSNRRLAVGFILAFCIANGVELLLKHSLAQPSPPPVPGLIPVSLPEDALRGFVLARFGMLAAAGGPVNSYPSGHMLRAGLVLFAIAAVWPRPAVRGITALIGVIAAFILIAARIHWLSDVAGGALLTWALASAVHAWSKRIPRSAPSCPSATTRPAISPLSRSTGRRP